MRTVLPLSLSTLNNHITLLVKSPIFSNVNTLQELSGHPALVTVIEDIKNNEGNTNNNNECNMSCSPRGVLFFSLTKKVPTWCDIWIHIYAMPEICARNNRKGLARSVFYVVRTVRD
jgi:hypothetical protein